MSEPDRFDKQAAEVLRAVMDAERRGDNMDPIIAAALRAAEASALERAAQGFDQLASMSVDLDSDAAARQIRALIPPAAAPATDYDPITAPIPEGDMNGPHGPLPAASAITYVNPEQWAAAGQPPLDDKKPREPGCQCHQEEGDSPCPVHDGETGKAPGAEAPDWWQDAINRAAATNREILARAEKAEVRLAELEGALRHAWGHARNAGCSGYLGQDFFARIEKVLAARAAPPEGKA